MATLDEWYDLVKDKCAQSIISTEIETFGVLLLLEVWKSKDEAPPVLYYRMWASEETTKRQNR